MMKRFYLAELNMARALYPLEDPRMAEFVANLDAINGLAERSPGFIWRLVNINGSTTTVRLFDDPLLLVNLSVWETELSSEGRFCSSSWGEMRERRPMFAKCVRCHHPLAQSHRIHSRCRSHWLRFGP